MKQAIYLRDTLKARQDMSYCISVDEKDFEEALETIDECINDYGNYAELGDYIESELNNKGIKFDYENNNVCEVIDCKL